MLNRLQGPDSTISEAVKRRRLTDVGDKEGKDFYGCRDYKRIIRLYRDSGIPYSVVDNIYLHAN